MRWRSTWRDHAPQPSSGSIAVRGKSGDLHRVDWIIEANALDNGSFKRNRASHMRHGVEFF